MKSLQFLLTIGAICLVFCSKTDSKSKLSLKQLQKITKSSIQKIMKTEEEWKKQLTPFEYQVLRQQGTERAFTGEYYDYKGKGTYICKACDLPLFDSKTKYRSGTGWPSFWDKITPENVGEKVDKKFGWTRTEVICNRCDSHLGHVFEDGPKPTGLRYCINSVCLKFVANDTNE